MTPLQKHRRRVAIAIAYLTLIAVAMTLGAFVCGVHVGRTFGFEETIQLIGDL